MLYSNEITVETKLRPVLSLKSRDYEGTFFKGSKPAVKMQPGEGRELAQALRRSLSAHLLAKANFETIFSSILCGIYATLGDQNGLVKLCLSRRRRAHAQTPNHTKTLRQLRPLLR